MRWFVRGDIDGFFGLALDNLVQLLLIKELCGLLDFPPEILYGKILPGVAVSLLVGNLFYAWQAKRLADASGRNDVCALPYGINTVSLIAYVFLVMLPAKLDAEERGLSALQCAEFAWQAGLIACLGSGLIELIGSLVAERIRRSTPRAALLSTLAGIAIGFISMDFFFRSYAQPVVGLATLGIVMLVYFGRVRFRGGLPGGFVAVAIGTALCWLTGVRGSEPFPRDWHLHPPLPVLDDLREALQGNHFTKYFSVILPMGLFNLIGSLQNIESAEAAGDSFPTAPSLAANGLGTVAATLFGSCFPTTIYIGHPGWKAMGSRAGYSILNGLFFTVVCLTGSLQQIAWLIPIEAAMAIVLWIGIVITAQAFEATPRQHAPAVVVGLLPGIAAWGTILALNSLRAVGFGTKAHPFGADLLTSFHKSKIWIDGAFALEKGFIFTSMILAAVTVAVIERHFIVAAVWCAIAALLSLTGLMHSYKIIDADVVLSLTPAYSWAAGYAIMAACFFSARWLTTPGEGH